MSEYVPFICESCGKHKSDYNSATRCCLNILNFAEPGGKPFRKSEVVRENPDQSLRVLDKKPARCGVCRRYIPAGWTVVKKDGVTRCRPNHACK